MHAVAQNPKTGDEQYHIICTNCHNNNPTQASGSYPAPAGTSAATLQGYINADYMVGNSTGEAAVAPLKRTDGTIAQTVKDIGAYLQNLNYSSLTYSSTSHAYGSVLTTNTVPFNITIGNNGRGSLTVTSIVAGDSANFGISSNCGTIAPNGSCTLTVTFRPQSGGPKTTNITVSHNGTVGATSIGSFTGTGVVPTPGFTRSPSFLTLDARFDGVDTDGGTVTVTNPSSATANLQIGNLTFSNPAVFTRGGTCVANSTVLPPTNASCTIVVTYKATALGSQDGTLTIAHNAPGSPATVMLFVTGRRSVIAPTSNTIDFGNVQQGVSKSLTQTINNNGDFPLNFRVPLPNAAGARSGAGAGDYTVSGCAAPVPASGSCTLTITLTPTTTGTRPATLTVLSDAFNGDASYTLAGVGVTLPEPTVSPNPAADFPDTVIGQFAALTRTVTVTNDRTRDVGLSVTAPTDFELGGGSCGSVVAGSTSCTVVLRFRPGVAGGETRRSGNFRFNFTGTSGDPNPTPIDVAVGGRALFPLQLSTTALTPSAVVGSPTVWTVVLTNRASSAFTLSGIAYGGAQGSDYSRDASSTCTAGASLAAGASCNLVTRFNPPTAGSRVGTITLTHTGSAGSLQTVALNGTAIPAPQGRIELSRTSVAFADTQLESSSAQTVTVHNGGDLALNFTAFTFGGSQAAEFSRGGTCAVGTPLAIAADCTVVVNFAPAALGVRNGNLTITSDASNGAAVITLSGTGVPIPAPQVTLTPATLDFGTQTIAGLYPSRQVRLVNSGTANLTIASITVAGAGFSNVSTPACPLTLAPGAGCDIAIAFAATAATAYTGTLTVTDNAAGSPHVSQLVGTGSASAMPVLVYSPAVSTLDFGNVSTGSVSATQTVTVRNQGPGGVELTVLNTVGADAASFSIVGGSCAVGAPLFEGGTCTVVLQFAPGSGGAKSAAVQIASTGSFPPVLTLTGTGLAGASPVLSLSSTAVSFDATAVGAQSTPASVRITSGGTGVVTVSAMAVSGDFSILSTTCATPPFSLPAGTECLVTLNFKPTDSGTASGTLRITSDAAPAVREIALSGTAEKTADTSSGGCTIGGGDGPADPLLWAMLLLAAGWLARRELQRRADARRGLRRIDDTSAQARRELP